MTLSQIDSLFSDLNDFQKDIVYKTDEWLDCPDISVISLSDQQFNMYPSPKNPVYIDSKNELIIYGNRIRKDDVPIPFSYLGIEFISAFTYTNKYTTSSPFRRSASI